MAGLMTHLIIATLGGILAWIIFKKWYYGGAFFIGHLAPDLIDFGITGLKIGSTNPSVIMQDSWFHPLMLLGHTFMHWVIFGIVIMFILMGLHNLNKIKKENYTAYILSLIMLLLGVTIHLIFDKLIIEKSYWI